MSTFPDDLTYSPNHTWMEVNNDGYLRVGISDFAQQELGDVVFIELPEVGRSYAEGEECGLIESVKSASDLYCPVSGEILRINQDVEENPENINQDPYGDGWIFEIRPAESLETYETLSSDEYQELISED